MTIVSSDVFRHVLESKWPHTNSENRLQVISPDGYLFAVENSASGGSAGRSQYASQYEYSHCLTY